MRLFEKYRPKRWDEVVGQDKAIADIMRLKERGGLGGRAYWIGGQSGTGKTTIALLLASEIADPIFIEELDATVLTPARLQEIEREMQMYGWGQSGKNGRAYIINEAHGLRRDAVHQLLVLLERLPSHVVVIFTTTTEGNQLFEDNEDSSPLLSRCVEIYLARRDLAKPFAERAKQIAQAEGLDGQPVERYHKLVQSCKNNLRKVLQEIEKGTMLTTKED
jgi:DNA polymerase III gamma/tau subunit